MPWTANSALRVAGKRCRSDLRHRIGEEGRVLLGVDERRAGGEARAARIARIIGTAAGGEGHDAGRNAGERGETRY